MSSNDDDRCGGSQPEDVARRKRHRNITRLAARDGGNLPSVRDLLLGCPFASGDIEKDARLWSGIVTKRLDTTAIEGAAVFHAISQLTVEMASLNEFRQARIALDGGRTVSEVPEVVAGVEAQPLRDRLDFYAAALGDVAACMRVAMLCDRQARASDCPTDEAALLFEAALGWLAAASGPRPSSILARRAGVVRTRQDAETSGSVAVREILHAAEAEAEVILEPHRQRDEIIKRELAPAPPARGYDIDVQYDLDQMIASGTAKPDETVVVVPYVGVAETTEGKKIQASHTGIGKSLPMPKVPDLAPVRSMLLGEFPHASAVIDALLGELHGREHVHLRPTLLVGDPGSGKTSFCVRLLELLGVRHQIYACGGASDASISGTPRQWSTGSPAMVVALSLRFETAAPGIILDEVEKCGRSHHNGNLISSALGFLEPASASRYLDVYFQSECDVSHAIWLATANSLDGVPATLRDRMRILRFPSPAPEHLQLLAPSMLRKSVQERGLSEAWALPLDALEMAALAQAWPGGSLRRLRRLVDGILAARDQPCGALS